MTHVFNPTENYKQVLFREDRDLMAWELNELQAMSAYERKLFFDMFLSDGAIIDGCTVTSITGGIVATAAGVLYLQGFFVRVPSTTLVFDAGATGTEYVWVEVLRRLIGASDNPALINDYTGEPTAEREQWVVSLQIRDTSGDAIPEGYTGRYTAKVYVFDREQGTVTTAETPAMDPETITAIRAHLNAGGNVHPAATSTTAGFMSAGDKAKLDGHVGSGGASHAKATAQADGFMAKEDKAALDGHIGAGGTSHAVATTLASGFMSAADKTKLDGIENSMTSHVGAGGNAHAAATTSSAGFMSAGDKQKLDTIDTSFSSHVGGGGTAHAAATTAAAGFLSATDKTKLDGLNDAAYVKKTGDQSMAGKLSVGHLGSSDASGWLLFDGAMFVIDALGLGDLKGFRARLSKDGGATGGGYAELFLDMTGALGSDKWVIADSRTSGRKAISFEGHTHQPEEVDGLIRTSTYVVAANDSSYWSKKGADFVCTGTDDHLVINQALTACATQGGKVLLLEGTFNVRDSVLINNNSSLEGVGEASIIKMKPPTFTNTSFYGLVFNGSNGRIAIRNLTIDGNKAELASWGGVNSYGVGQNGGSSQLRSLCIEGVVVKNVVTHSILLNDYDLTIRNCRISDGTNDGINAAASIAMIEGNVISNNSGNGIAFVGTGTDKDVIIARNNCRGNGESGLYLSSCSDAIVSGNICNRNGEHGIYLNDMTSCIVEGNVCDKNSTSNSGYFDGIHVRGGGYVSVSNNKSRSATVAPMQRYGLYLYTGDFHTAMSNDLYGGGMGVGATPTIKDLQNSTSNGHIGQNRLTSGVKTGTG